MKPTIFLVRKVDFTNTLKYNKLVLHKRKTNWEECEILKFSVYQTVSPNNPDQAYIRTGLAPYRTSASCLTKMLMRTRKMRS